MVQGLARSILKSLSSQPFLLLGISILVKGMDVPLSPVTPNVVLIRKDMCVRGDLEVRPSSVAPDPAESRGAPQIPWFKYTKRLLYTQLGSQQGLH